MKILKNRKAQIWVETVIYTLIGLTIIGLLLGVARPKIAEIQDRLLIEQTIDSLGKVNSQIFDVQIAPGNKRILNLKVSKGRFYINASANEIGWILESNYKYSEIEQQVNLGNLYVLTEEAGPYLVTITMNYSVNLTYEDSNSADKQQFEASPQPYVFNIENKGTTSSTTTRIDLSVS